MSSRVTDGTKPSQDSAPTPGDHPPHPSRHDVWQDSVQCPQPCSSRQSVWSVYSTALCNCLTIVNPPPPPPFLGAENTWAGSEYPDLGLSQPGSHWQTIKTITSDLKNYNCYSSSLWEPDEIIKYFSCTFLFCVFVAVQNWGLRRHSNIRQRWNNPDFRVACQKLVMSHKNLFHFTFKQWCPMWMNTSLGPT